MSERRAKYLDAIIRETADDGHAPLNAVAWNDPENELVSLTDYFSNSEFWLRTYSTDEYARAVWHLAGTASYDFFRPVFDPAIEWSIREAAILAVTPLFENFFTKYCTPKCSHGTVRAIPGENINLICYMFWDICPLHPDMCDDQDHAYTDSCFDVLARILAIDHVACQEAALHGLGHWAHRHGDRSAAIINRALRAPRPVPEVLESYARRAMVGDVM